MSEQHTGRTAGPRAPRFGRAEQELLTGGVVLAIALYLRLNLEAHVVGRRGVGFVDPDFWPSWLLNFIVVTAAVYLFQTWRRRAAAAEPSGVATVTERLAEPAGPSADSASPDDAPMAGNLGRLLLGFGLLWSYIFAMTRIGFLPSTLLFAVIFLVFVGERRPLVIVAIPVTIAGSVLFVFTRLLVVPLPRGTGFFLELSTFFY